MRIRDMLYVIWQKVKQTRSDSAIVLEDITSAEYTVEANDIKEITIDASKDGYRIVGIQSQSTGHTQYILYYWWVYDNSTIQLLVWNRANYSHTTRMYLRVAYQKI